MNNIKNKGGRPTKHERKVKILRDKELRELFNKGYPLDYLATYFNLTKGRIVQICGARSGDGRSPEEGKVNQNG